MKRLEFIKKGAKNNMKKILSLLISNKFHIILFFTIILLVIIIGIFGKKIDDSTTKEGYFSSIPSNLTYDKVVNSKLEQTNTPEIYKSKYDGEIIRWQGKISAYHSQITGIKFCVIDEEHQNVDIDKPCDWFWAFSDDVMNADNLEVNPNWDGYWVNYILRYYKVPFNEKDYFYNDIYTLEGRINRIDCGVDNKCVPNIDILGITK